MTDRKQQLSGHEILIKFYPISAASPHPSAPPSHALLPCHPTPYLPFLTPHSVYLPSFTLLNMKYSINHSPTHNYSFIVILHNLSLIERLLLAPLSLPPLPPYARHIIMLISTLNIHLLWMF